MCEKNILNYDQLLEIVSWGIFSMDMKGNSVCDKRLDKIKKIDGAAYGGVYVGSPGRDIYSMLPYLNDHQTKEISVLLCSKFPKKPPRTYANIAACIRFIYGQFEKQGSLRSDKDFERMKKEKIDWSLSRNFLKLVMKELKNRNNYYGLTMLYEMEGHRLGDEAVISKNRSKLEKMEKNYNKCVKYAGKCRGYKHMFSIYYWAYEYFRKFGDVKNSIKYAELSIINANKYYYKYFPKGEQYYSNRLLKAFKYIDKMEDSNKNKLRSFLKKIIGE